MQRKKSHRNKLLITLVLFMVALSAVWTTTQADARGLVAQPLSNGLSPSDPGAIIASGDPDIGQGNAPANPTTKVLKMLRVGGVGGGHPFGDWVRWAGRIWATLFQRVAA